MSETKAIYEVEVYDENGTFLRQEDRPLARLGKAARGLENIADSFFELYPEATCIDIHVIWQKTVREDGE